MTSNSPKPALPEQTRVLDVFQYAGLTCAHTSTEDGTSDWWHLWDATGRDLGSTNRPELLGLLIHPAH